MSTRQVRPGWSLVAPGLALVLGPMVALGAGDDNLGLLAASLTLLVWPGTAALVGLWVGKRHG